MNKISTKRENMKPTLFIFMAAVLMTSSSAFAAWNSLLACESGAIEIVSNSVDPTVVGLRINNKAVADQLVKQAPGLWGYQPGKILASKEWKPVTQASEFEGLLNQTSYEFWVNVHRDSNGIRIVVDQHAITYCYPDSDGYEQCRTTESKPGVFNQLFQNCQ